MAIVLKGGAIFLHIPKTGGSWVTRVLQQLDLIEGRIGHMHADADRLMNAYRFSGIKAHAGYLIRKKVRKKLRHFSQTAERPAKPYMFCFVRHPLSWYESWFKYQSLRWNWRTWGTELNPDDWHPLSMLNGLGGNTFTEFMNNVLARRPGFVTELYGAYTKPNIVDFVGHQENLQEDLIQVLTRLGLPHDPAVIRSMPPENVSTDSNLQIHWNPALRAEVERLEYASLVRYRYPQQDGNPGLPYPKQARLSLVENSQAPCRFR